MALDKRPGVRPVGIGEALHRALAKLVMRSARDQAKMACGNLQLLAGLEADIEGGTHTVGKRRLTRVREQREETEEMEVDEVEEEESGGSAADFHNLNIDMAVTEEEAAEGLADALEMEVKEDRGSEGEDGGGGTQRALEAIEFLTQEADTSGTTLVDARNGFNKLSRLTMLWNVQHHWTAGARFAFYCYLH